MADLGEEGALVPPPVPERGGSPSTKSAKQYTLSAVTRRYTWSTARGHCAAPPAFVLLLDSCSSASRNSSVSAQRVPCTACGTPHAELQQRSEVYSQAVAYFEVEEGPRVCVQIMLESHP